MLKSLIRLRVIKTLATSLDIKQTQLWWLKQLKVKFNKFKSKSTSKNILSKLNWLNLDLSKSKRIQPCKLWYKCYTLFEFRDILGYFHIKSEYFGIYHRFVVYTELESNHVFLVYFSWVDSKSNWFESSRLIIKVRKI